MEPDEIHIGVVSLGQVPKDAIEQIRMQITSCFAYAAKILPPMVYPVFAFDENRLQYDAGKIISSLETIAFEGCNKIIGVLTDDLFVPVFTHVFGEARQGGRCALVSLFRMENDYERSAKVAIHELGHLFDLPHCQDHACLMHFSAGIEALDHTPVRFCRYCRAYLENITGLYLPVHQG